MSHVFFNLPNRIFRNKIINSQPITTINGDDPFQESQETLSCCRQSPPNPPCDNLDKLNKPRNPISMINHTTENNHENNHTQIQFQDQNKKPVIHKCLPKRIILVRHGESQGNRDDSAYSVTPDYKIPLTQRGIEQAKQAGSRILDVVSDEGSSENWKVYFYVSPYVRTRSTLREIGRDIPRRRVLGVREECRVREQDFGNFQVTERMKVIKENRERFGRFFYRFPEGESAADVYDRVSSFLESLWRDIDMNRHHHDPDDDLNLVIISHGLAIRVFLMKWFKWTVEQFEYLNNPGNCELRVMQLGVGGEYSLAVHHTEEEMVEWGLTPEIISDQKWRAHATRGAWNEKCPWYLDSFFDHLTDSDDDGDGDGEEVEVKSNDSFSC